jgi:hypothetical protein
MKLTKLLPQNYPNYKAFFNGQRYELSVYSLASILAWRNQVYQPYGIVLEDTLVVGVNYTNPDKPHHLLLPISPNREYAPAELHGLARKLGYDLFQFVPGDYIQRYDTQEITDLFDIRPQVEYDDYVYRTEDLAGLKGNRFSKKRNLIHQFKSEYVKPGRVQVEKMTGKDATECLDFLEDWCLARDCDQNPEEDLACEKQAAVHAIENFETLEMSGLLVRIDGQVSAFGIAAPVTIDMGALHFEKAYGDIKGLYQYLDQQCAQHLFGKRQFINKESDMGVAGIAQAKKSYHPARMINSYQLILR